MTSASPSHFDLKQLLFVLYNNERFILNHSDAMWV
jgi:hypothetical protein